MASNITSATITSGTSSSVVVGPSSSVSSIVSSISSAASAASSSASVAQSSSSPISTAPSSSIAPSTSIVSISPTSTVYVPPSISSTAPTFVSTIDTTVATTVDPASTGGTSPSYVTIITTQSTVTVKPTGNGSNTRSSSSSASPTTLSPSDTSNGSSGLSTSGKIAIAVIIPVIVVAGAFFLGLFFWRKRKAKKNAQELRKNEMAEYGFNPNDDPTLAPIAAAAYTDGASEAADDGGYRGWGTTNSNTRKASTTLGSNSRAQQGLAVSDSGSQPGGYNGYQGSPSNGASEHYSGDPLVGGHNEGIEGAAAFGGAAAAGGAIGVAISKNNRNSQGNNRSDVHRGPSNASSTYSHAPHSDSSAEIPYAGPYTHEEVPYNIYNDAAPSHGPYGDGSYNGGDAQPVIRDVQAKRNTRIERAPTFPQGGIAQNF